VMEEHTGGRVDVGVWVLGLQVKSATDHLLLRDGNSPFRAR
jgi:hypothetical protein